MTKPCKFKAGACVHCGDKSRLNSSGEKCDGWNPSEEISHVLSMTRAQLSQQIGEMTAQEWRTVQAVFRLIKESK